MPDSRTVARQRRLPFQLAAPHNDRLAVHIVYGLYAASLVFGIPSVLGVLLAYLKREDVEGSYLETHVRWQIRTFWIWLLLFIVGAATALLLVGLLIMAIAQIWFLYRVIRGWLLLADERPMPDPGGLV